MRHLCAEAAHAQPLPAGYSMPSYPLPPPNDYFRKANGVGLPAMFQGTTALLIILSATACSWCASSRPKLPFGLFLSRSGPISYERVLPAVELALSLVNNDTSVLPGFSLGYPQDAFVDAMVSGLHVLHSKLKSAVT